jgi:uncharacterized protein YeaO (DUF488 family)
MITIKRAYEATKEDDGYRILVDRLWPRGVSKEKAKLDRWMKDIAPSNELRKWFGHDPDRWEAFKKKYLNEIQEHMELVKELKEIIQENDTVTLIYSAKDEEHNNAVVLLELLKQP